jgi:signal transduction histidine kinase
LTFLLDFDPLYNFLVSPSDEDPGLGQRNVSRVSEEAEDGKPVQEERDIIRRLIEAVETERSRIARELHDDINQRIALLAVSLERIESNLTTSDSRIRGQISQVRQGLSDLGNDIQFLSHQLRSSKLDYLGLVPAARSLCRELSERHNIEIIFSAEAVVGKLPSQVSLCLYRVLQEALQNALKHSGARRFTVDLRETPKQIQLTVGDNGCGFDQHAAAHNRGLGLISMHERMRLVDGILTIQSARNQGTTVQATIPFKA